MKTTSLNELPSRLFKEENKVEENGIGTPHFSDNGSQSERSQKTSRMF